MSDKERLYNLLKETFILLDDGDRRLFNHFNLTPPRFYAMLHISEEPGLSSSDLSNRLLCDKSNVTRIVKGLENSGLVDRHPHETDGRTIRLYLTQEGQNICEQVQTAHKNYNAARLDCLNEIANGSLIENLTILNESLQSSLAQPGQATNGSTS